MDRPFSTHGGSDAHDTALRLVREGRERVDREHSAVNDGVSSRAFEPYAMQYAQAGAAGTLLESALRSADAAFLVGRPAMHSGRAAPENRCLEEFDGFRAGAADLGAGGAAGAGYAIGAEATEDAPIAPASSDGLFGVGTRPNLSLGSRG